MSNIFIVAAKRTPFGAFGGSLKKLSATELGTIATKSAITTANIDPSVIDAVYFGNVIQSSADAAYMARHIGLQSGIPIATPALTINRLCGSGFETVIQGAKSIKLGEAKIVVCGGSENMSMAPLQVDGNDARWGVSLGSGLKMRDSLWDGYVYIVISCVSCRIVFVLYLTYCMLYISYITISNFIVSLTRMLVLQWVSQLKI